MIRPFLCLAAWLCVTHLCASAPANEAQARPTVIVLVGASGEDEFGQVFRESAAAWEKAAASGGAKLVTIGITNVPATNDLREFRAAMEGEATNSAGELWIVLLGHGTFDSRDAKFNLRGPDLSTAGLTNLLATIQRPVALINASSASAPFIKALAHTNRIVVTATRSGAEENYARFGKYISEAIADPAADLDKDGQTSLLEAFLIASRSVQEFYKSEGRLATEHALFDDNGDGLGTPADWFRGIRAVKTAQSGVVDGLRAHQWHLVRSSDEQKLSPEQRKRRNDLEIEIANLRQRKAHLAEDDYYAELEKLLIRLAPIILSDETKSAAKE